MKTLLVIEDNTDVRENLCEILELSGYKTVEAENGKIGVQKARSEKPDLIICDVMMPELDGFGVLRILNRDPHLMHIPFMFLTAKAEKTDFRKGMGLGADDYITKPFDEVELLDAIEMRIKKSEKIASISNTEEGVRQFFSEAKAEKAFEELSENRDFRKYEKKNYIYEIDQRPKYLFYLLSGQVKTVQIADSGKELISNVYSPGDFIGLVSLLQEAPYIDNAICTQDCEVLLIPLEDFRLLMFNNRDFSAKFIKMLAHQARHSEEQLLDLAYSSVRKKVSKALIIYGEKNTSDLLEISRDDLASMAGTTRESVIRTLSDFKSEGLIEIVNNKISILNKSKLENLPQ